MRHAIDIVALNAVAVAAVARVVGIAIGAGRSIWNRHRFVTFRVGTVELLTWLEPPALAAVTLALFPDRSAPSVAETVAAVAGALVAVTGFGVIIWSLFSWRQLFVGHGVLEGHELVTGGAYGLVRHPVYLGAIWIWWGLSLAYLSPLAAIVTALYVVPIYVLYIRSEEKMMVSEMGSSYGEYRERVPMLIPRLRR